MVVMHVLAHAKDVTVWMSHVHLTHSPRFVLRRPRDLQIFAAAAVVHGVDVVGPDRQPDTALAATALSIATQTDFEVIGAHRAKGWFAAVGRPVPLAGPAQLFEPREAADQARDIQDRYH